MQPVMEMYSDPDDEARTVLRFNCQNQPDPRWRWHYQHQLMTEHAEDLSLLARLVDWIKARHMVDAGCDCFQPFADQIRARLKARQMGVV